MQNKLHTILCHPVPIPIAIGTVGIVEASHSLITRLTHFQIFKLFHYRILFLILFPLWGLGGFAQTYDWDWKLSGGSGNKSAPNESYYNFEANSEQIYDVKVGTDNNYYFIGTVRGIYGVQLDGQPITTNGNALNGTNDIFLFSTTCDGTVRWKRAIGGGSDDEAYNLVLDSENNVYIGVFVKYGSVSWSQQFPVRFSETDSLPYAPSSASVVSDYWKTSFLLKYDHNGALVKRKALQGDVDGLEYLPPYLLDLAIDSEDCLHFIVGLRKGTGYLDGNVSVPGTVFAFHFYLAKYDSNLDYISSMKLPVADSTSFGRKYSTRFAYDEALNRYYVAGIRSAGGITSPLTPLTYDGKAFVERSYILAIDGTDGSEAWRREIYTDPLGNNLASNEITSLIVDANSEVYIGGRIWTSWNVNWPASKPDVKIYDPHNPAQTTYIFTPDVYTQIPMVVKFNSSGTVQWAKTPTDFTSNFMSSEGMFSKGFSLRHNEIAFGTKNSYFIWDGFIPNKPKYSRGDPTLLRLDKQTGMTVGMHMIPGTPEDNEGMTAVAVDNDGNYVTAGYFFNYLFPTSVGADLVSSGYSDFFVAKLAASVCGTAVGIEQFTTLKLNVYPNPTNDIVNIETDEQLSNYIIYDVSGRQIQSHLFTGSNQINLQNVSTGVYFIKVITVQGNSGTVRVVKK